MLSGGPLNFFSQIKPLGIFRLTKIVRPEKFLQADDLRPLLGRFSDTPLGFSQVEGRILTTAHLDQADFYNFIVGN